MDNVHVSNLFLPGLSGLAASGSGERVAPNGPSAGVTVAPLLRMRWTHPSEIALVCAETLGRQHRRSRAAAFSVKSRFYFGSRKFLRLHKQRLAAKFPNQQNRELSREEQGILAQKQGFCLLKTEIVAG
jgi:hypothetical protein